MTAPAKVLIVDDEKLIRWSLREQLTAMGMEVLEAEDGLKGLETAVTQNPDIILLDIRMPGTDGMTVLRELRKRDHPAAVVMISAHATLEVAVEAMKEGATDFIKKPFQPEEVDLLVARLSDKLALEREARTYREREERRYNAHQVVGESPCARQARELVAKIASSAATNILIEGESGAGKGLAAKIIHHSGNRRRGPFIEVDCTSLPANLVESELFGHERGAFTDAKQAKQGLFEAADGGTIFLDEIGELPAAAQAKLLRVLEDRTFKRVGGVKDISVDVRVVAATNRDLGAMAAEGTFRQDLYYRLTVLKVRLAPLRERTDDIPALARHFIAQFNQEFRRSTLGVAPDALAALIGYPWPGNVRELRNCIERVMILEDKQWIELEDLPPDVVDPPPWEALFPAVGPTLTAPPHAAPQLPAVPAPAAPTPANLEEMEKTLILQALEKTRWNQTRAARVLGITRDTLRYRIKKHGLLEA